MTALGDLEKMEGRGRASKGADAFGVAFGAGVAAEVEGAAVAAAIEARVVVEADGPWPDRLCSAWPSDTTWGNAIAGSIST